ncbi:MAG: PDZ domain-containing protein [Planctomycetota bacterium]
MRDALSCDAPSCCPGPELLLLLAEGCDELLEGEDPRALREHLAGCPRCQAAQAALDGALAAPALPFDPLDLLPAIREQLQAAPAPAAAEEPALAGVRLLCTYCKDALAPLEVVYCAGCLAPHHGDCFAEHGRCSAPGCEGQRVVRAHEAPLPARRRSPLWIGLGLVACAGSVAALAGGGARALWRPGASTVAAAPPREPAPERSPSPSPPAPAPAPSPGPELAPAAAEGLVTRAYDVADLLGPADPDHGPELARQVQRRLESQQVSLNFQGTPLGQVVGFLQDITGLDIALSPEVDPELPVELRLRDVLLRDGLRLIVEQTGVTYSQVQSAILITPPVGRRVRTLPAHPPLRPRQPGLSVGGLLDLARGAVGHGRPNALRPPAALDLDERAKHLVATLPEPEHAALVALLQHLRPTELVAPFRDAWFAPAPRAPEPARARALAHWARLQRAADATYEGRSACDVLADLAARVEVPLRIRPAARAELERAGSGEGAAARARATRPALRLRGSSVAAALELVLSFHDGLVFDVDRDGVLVRLGASAPDEQLLEEAAGDALSTQGAEVLLIAQRAPQVELPAGQATVRELLDLVRDASGQNLVLSRAAQASAGRSLDLGPEPRKWGALDALEQILRPVSLGLRVREGVLQVVPRREASLRPERADAIAALQTRVVCAEPAVGLSVGELAGALERATGAQVVLSLPAADLATRLLLPAGADVSAALELASGQGGLSWSWAWCGERPVLAIGRGAPAPDLVSLCERLDPAAQDAPRPGAPVAVERAVAQREAALRAALIGLAALREQAGAADLRARLEAGLGAARVAAAGLDDARAAQRALAPRPPEAARGDDLTPALFAELQRVRASQRALVRRRDVERVAEEDRLRVERDTQLEEARESSRRRLLRDRLHALLPYGGSLPELDLLRARLAQEPYEQVAPRGFGPLLEAAAAAASARLDAGIDALCALDALVVERGGHLQVAWTGPGSLATRAGLKPDFPGERLLACGGQPVTRLLELVDRLGAATLAGRKAELEVQDLHGARRVLRLALRPAPEGQEGGLGAQLDPSLGVTSAPAGSPLRAGDQVLALDGVSFRVRRRLAGYVAHLRRGEEVTLRVRRAGQELDLRLRLGEQSPWELAWAREPYDVPQRELLATEAAAGELR